MEEDHSEILKEPAKVNVRTFRASAEVENLYRFISEMRLRKEAKIVFQKVSSSIKTPKTSRERKKQ